MLICNNIYGTRPVATYRPADSFESLLERYPWFDAAHRLTCKDGGRLPANVLLINYLRPPQSVFRATVSNVPSDVTVATVPPTPYTRAEQQAAESIRHREEQRERRADADESDFPTIGGIASILGDDVERGAAADDIIAAFVAGGEHRIEFNAPASLPELSTALVVSDDPAALEIAAFLRLEDYRIDPEEYSPPPSKERLECAVDLSEGNFVSEALGLIYLKQNLLDEAREIYSQLSLQNPEKSSYFATLIAEAQVRADVRRDEQKRGLRRG